MQYDIEIVLNVLDVDIDVDVVYTIEGKYYPASRETPEEFPEIQIVSVLLNNSKIDPILDDPLIREKIIELVEEARND